jgi:putative FmdB family regulatory protein
MPIYEYRCLNCQRKVSIFWRSLGAVDASKARCTHCGSPKLTKLVSRVRVIRGGSSSASSGASDASEPGPGGDMDEGFMREMEGMDENDPRQLGRLMRKMASQSGEDMGPEFNEVVGRLERGEDPEKIEQKMGDLFGEPGPGGAEDMLGDDMGAPPPPAEDAGESEPPAKGEASGKKTPRQTKTVRRKGTHTPATKKSGATRRSAKGGKNSN